MTGHLRRRIVLTAFAALVASPAGAQDTPIKSVRFRVEPKTTGAITLAIENTRDSALLAWRIQLGQNGGVTESNQFGNVQRSGGNPAAISPHETRTSPFPMGSDGAVSDIRVLAAIFADGHYQGSPADLEKLVASRKGRAEELAYWVDAFNKVPEGTNKDKTDYLVAKLGERAGQADPDPTFMFRSNLRSSLSDVPRPEWWVSRMVEDYKPQLAAALRDATRPLVPIAADEPPSVIVHVTPSTRTDYVAYLENLRDDASIEAWAIDTSQSSDGRSRSTQTVDACISDPALDDASRARGLSVNGRIRPHDVRAMPISGQSSTVASQIRLTMVMFDDLSFEGSASERDRIFQLRERRADETRFWLQAFKEAAAVSPDQMKTFLQAKRGEHARQDALSASGSTSYLVDQAIAALQRSPETFLEWLTFQVTMLEGQYARLTRHLKR